MRDRQRGGIETPVIDPSELAAILAEVRRAVLAVDEGTGEHGPLRDIRLTVPRGTGVEARPGRDPRRPPGAG